MAAVSKSYLMLVFFVAVVLGVGFSIGLTIRPGEWYEALSKPWFTPPNWLFAPAWTLVYMSIAIAGWRVTITEGGRSTPFRLWIAQMILNWAWTPVFFGLHQIGFGLVVIMCLLACVLVFIVKVQDDAARWCFALYALWLIYATSLNSAIFILN